MTKIEEINNAARAAKGYTSERGRDCPNTAAITAALQPLIDTMAARSDAAQTAADEIAKDCGSYWGANLNPQWCEERNNLHIEAWALRCAVSELKKALKDATN